MKEESKANLIERYIQGKLEDTELWEFKADMEKDADLAKEVKMRQEIYSVIKDKNKMGLFSTLNSIQTKKKKRVLKINIYSRQVQAIAASIIVFMIVGAGLLANIGNNYNSNYNIFM